MSDKRRALLLEPGLYEPASLARLSDAGVDPEVRNCGTQRELIATLAEAREHKRPFCALFVRLGLSVDAHVIAAGGDSLRWIVTPTTGTGHIDVADAEKRNIRVVSLKGETAFLRTITSTAELAWGLLLATVRSIPAAHDDVLANEWRREPFRGRELAGKTLGIVGLGRLGTMVARYGLAFGMNVVACDVRPEVFADPANTAVRARTMEALLAESDVVSIHLPLEPATQGLIGKARIARMKRGAYLINTARGEVLDEDALLDALESGALGGAALDVLRGDSRWERGVPEDHPLAAYARRHSNLILTPHIGGYSIDAITKTRSFMVERFCALSDR